MKNLVSRFNAVMLLSSFFYGGKIEYKEHLNQIVNRKKYYERVTVKQAVK